MSEHVISDIQALAPLTGDDNKFLCQYFDTIKDNQTDVRSLNEALKGIGRILKRCFDMDCDFTILDTRLDNDFFGFHIYPALNTLSSIVGIMNMDNKDLSERFALDRGNKIRENWRQNTQWHIDLDAKLFFAPSIRFTPREIVALLIYEIEKRVFSFDTVISVYNTLATLLYKLDYRTKAIICAPAAQAFLVIPFLQACGYTSYTSTPNSESLLSLLPELGNDYRTAITKIATRYSSGLIDPLASELNQKLSYTFSWMSEGLVGLKYTLHDVKKALEDAILAEKSYYVKNALVSIYNCFCYYDKTGIIAEAHLPQVPPLYLEVQDKSKMKKFQAKLQYAAEAAESQLLDSLGRCKKVTQEEIDVLRIEIEKIETVDDKIYLLEKVYNKLAIVNNALDLIGDKDTKGRVRDSKEKLLKQKEDLLEIRELVMAKKITPEHYGLYIKYPAGYEG